MLSLSCAISWHCREHARQRERAGLAPNEWDVLPDNQRCRRREKMGPTHLNRLNHEG